MPPYNSNRSGSIAALMLRQGDIDAQRTQRVGDANAGLLDNLSHIAVGALTDRAKMQEAAPAKKYAADQIAAGQKTLDRKTALDAALVKHKGDVEAAADELDETDPVGARALRDEHHEQVDRQVTQAGQRIAQVTDTVGKASQIVQEMGRDPKLYGQLRAQLVGLANTVAPELVSQIPDVYDPPTIAAITQKLITTQQDYQHATVGLQKITAAFTSRGNAQEAIAEAFASAMNEEQWNNTIAVASASGASPEMVDRFGKWDKDAPARANRLGMSYKERAAAAIAADESGQKWERLRIDAQKADQDSGGKPGSLESAVIAYARKNGKAIDSLTEAEINGVKARHEASGRAPTKDDYLWVMRDGKQLRIKEGEYKPGDKQAPPSSRDEEQQTYTRERALYADYVRNFRATQDKWAPSQKPALEFNEWRATQSPDSGMPTEPILGDRVANASVADTLNGLPPPVDNLPAVAAPPKPKVPAMPAKHYVGERLRNKAGEIVTVTEVSPDGKRVKTR